MNARWNRLGWLVSVVFLFTPLLAAVAAESPPEAEASDWPAAELTLGLRTGDAETEGIGDLLIPVWSPGGKGLLFLNPRTAVSDRSAEEYNLGIGYRHLLPMQDVILGANAYYDYRDTRAGHYTQWGVGAELLTRWIDARANYYKPRDKTYVVAQETETTQRQSVRTSTGWQDPYATGHAIVQDYTITRSLITETTTRTFEQYQQASKGWDAEIGVRLPLPIQPETLEARVFGGYYDFERDYRDDVKGWKARAEVRLASSLFLDAGIYENEDLNGSDWFAGARVSLPLDLADLAQGRNPFSTARSRLNREPREFSSRLTEMVMRDPQIQLETSGLIENPDLTTQSVRRKTSRRRDTITLLPDVMFVHGDLGSSSGSAENPYGTIQQAADNVFGARNIYVYNASGAYNENVVLQDGTTLWGSGARVPGMGGKSYGSGIAPIVDGMSMGPSITMADRTTVRGMHVRNTDMGGPPLWVMGAALGPYDVSRVGIFGNNATDLLIDQNVIAGNSIGALLPREGDFNLVFRNNLVMNNTDSGLFISGLGASGTFNAVVENSHFVGNQAFGAEIYAGNYDFALTQIRNSSFTGNDWGGLFTLTDHSILAMTLVSGVNASGNVGSGIGVDQQNNLIGLINLSGIVANNSQVGDGIWLTQNNDLASVGVVGMPRGFGDLALAITDLVGLGLPDEVLAFFEPSGGVTASGNAGSGIVGNINADGLAFGSFFDITANENAWAGFNVSMDSPGLALGLAGSSQNLADILQIGLDVAGLFDIDLPNIAGDGQMQLNNNNALGMSFRVNGGFGAFAGVAGLEVSGNDELGALVEATGGLFGVAALARLDINNNAWNPFDPLDPEGGLILNVGADGLALGIIADANVSDNGGYGIQANVESDSIAALLTLSTDGLRPLAGFLGETFLGEPYDLPGDPWGPVTANNNFGPGILANVSGDNLALAAFLDTQANNNWDHGFDVTVQSDAGSALAAFLSTDLLYDVVPPLFGGDPIPGAGLGGVQANNNWPGNGINLNVDGFDMALALMAGVEASDNLSDGIFANLQANESDAIALFYDVEASRNIFGLGIAVSLFSDQQSTVAGFLDVVANRNWGSGLELQSFSPNGSAFALLAGVETWDNLNSGIVLDLEAGVDAVAALTAIESWENWGDGIDVNLWGNDNTYLFAGSMAALDMDGVFEFSGMLGPTMDMIRQDGLHLYDNQGDGLDVSAFSFGNVNTAIVGANTHGNLGNGIWVNTFSIGNSATFLADISTMANGNQGILLDTSANGDTLFAVADVYADENWMNNIEINALSLSGSTLGILGNIGSYRSVNGSGILADLSAANDAVLVMTDIASIDNDRFGASVSLNAGNNVFLFVGNQALGNLEAMVGPVSLPAAFDDILVQGNCIFNGNGTAGLRAELESDTGDVTALLSGVSAVMNQNNGINLILNAPAGDLFARVQNTSAFLNQGNSGVRIELNGGGGSAVAWFEAVNSSVNAGNGIHVIENYNGSVEIGGQENVLIDNDNNGIRVATSGLGGVPVIDFGGGLMGSIGQNVLFGNLNVDFRYNNGGGATAMAENNWWNMDADPVANGRTAGNVDATPWLPAAP